MTYALRVKILPMNFNLTIQRVLTNPSTRSSTLTYKRSSILFKQQGQIDLGYLMKVVFVAQHSQVAMQANRYLKTSPNHLVVKDLWIAYESSKNLLSIQ